MLICRAWGSGSRVCECPMTGALASLRADVSRDDVVRAIEEYDRLGPDGFFSAHGFGRSRSYELVWDERRYTHKAILGTAYEFATGRRLDSGDFEGGKSGAVAVLRELGFTVELEHLTRQIDGETEEDWALGFSTRPA